MKKFIQKGLIFSLLFFIGCGYKPSTEYTSNILGNKIATSVDIDVQNPTDSVFLKDALNESVLSVFNSKVTSKNPNSKIHLKVNSINISTLDYDKNGYAILYRANASITAYITDKNNTTFSYQGSGSYDFAVNDNASVSDTIRHNAIKEAFLKALQMIEFKIANRGINNDN